MYKRSVLIALLLIMSAALCFGQAGALRDYVGLLSIRYHPDVIDYMGKFRESFEKKGYSNAAKAIDDYLKGLSGSGFVYIAPDGDCYVLTNAHVIDQSESLSITFEKLDGSKTIYDGLKVLQIDEEHDLALLVFDSGVRPFTQSLSFDARQVDEGSDVFAAGFPGLGNTAIWQFSRGTVSNAAVRLPKNNDSDETIGPFIQHTAQIDPGNSGGPLLMATDGVPTGYAVVGINTLSAYRRQAANYAIPVNQIQAFIGEALSNEPVNERELITKKVDAFLQGLKANRAVYDHIAQYLSNGCTASNAEYAISELLDRAPRTVLQDIDRTFSNDPVSGMSAAVGWYIEQSMRSKSGAIRISLNSISSDDRGGFNVEFNVDDEIVNSVWIKEYGVYRMNTYGDSVTGDKTLLDQKQKKKERDEALRTDSAFAITAGYSYVIDYGSALYVGMRFSNPMTIGIDVIYGFSDEKYLHIGMNGGYVFPIRLETTAFIPFFDIGVAYLKSEASKDESTVDRWDSGPGFGFAIGFTLKAGLMFTTSKVPGLFGRAFYEHDFVLFKDQNKAIKAHGIIGISVGYSI